MKDDCKKFTSGSYVESRGYQEDAMGCKQLRFNTVKPGAPFSLERPTFRAGIIDENNVYVPRLERNKRRGLGNRHITRTNFIAPPVKGREVISFEKLQAQDIESAGVKVQLGDKTIEQLLKIQVDDPTDVKWIDEKNRRLRAGETEEEIKQNPPFGRPQRKVSRMTNFGMMGLRLEDKIEAISTALKNGNALPKVQLAEITANIMQLISDQKEVSKMTKVEIDSIKKSIDQLNINKNHKIALPDLPQVIDKETFDKHKGAILLYLLANVPLGRNIDKPVYSNLSKQYITISTVLKLKTDNYLDLEAKTLDNIFTLDNKGLRPPGAIDLTGIESDNDDGEERKYDERERIPTDDDSGNEGF